MENKTSKIIDVIGRSIAFVVINYLLVSTELSFKANILGLIAFFFCTAEKNLRVILESVILLYDSVIAKGNWAVRPIGSHKR